MISRPQLDVSESVPDTVRYYLDRIEQVLLRLDREAEAERLLSIRLAPDMLDTGFNFAIAIGFAGRALCPPAKIDVPDIPDQHTTESLLGFLHLVSDLIAPITTADFGATVAHRAGDAELVQETAEYVTCFALPNMMFHFSVAYAGLRHGGMKIGKADFDGFHIYD